MRKGRLCASVCRGICLAERAPRGVRRRGEKRASFARLLGSPVAAGIPGTGEDGSLIGGRKCGRRYIVRRVQDPAGPRRVGWANLLWPSVSHAKFSSRLYVCAHVVVVVVVIDFESRISGVGRRCVLFEAIFAFYAEAKYTLFRREILLFSKPNFVGRWQ